MFTIYKKEVSWGGKQLTLETGRIARQADGAVLATYGETVVLAAVTFAKKPMEGVDFFPLTSTYQEKFYAAGRIPGGFFKREGRPTEKETLVSRLIDRPIRPLFAKGFKNETQVVTTVMSSDGENDSDMVAMVAASAALAISGAPFLGPIYGARVGLIDNKLVLNPTFEERKESALDLCVAGTNEGVLMVESEASELPEDVMLEAVMFGQDEGQKVIAAINELAEAAGKPAHIMPEAEDYSDLEAKLEKAYGADIKKAYGIQAKQERSNALADIRAAATEAHAKDDEAMGEVVAKLVKGMEGTVLRKDVLKNKTRIDGRTPVDVRPIVAEVDILPRTHGSALFTRGETQALVVATLGTALDEQMIDSINGESKERFMLHYNFPPYSVGEARRMGPPGRREIGHGKLAWRSIVRQLPSKEDFPYTMRIVSEITESNGSSSMATVCGASMALMAAGVPMAKPVAGIAMGLVKEGKDYVVLSDIMGDEDHLGDMDFKVAGTDEGITALQMDIKITSITKDIMEKALEQAHAGRMHILGKMEAGITSGREQISEHAPAMKSFEINKDKIRDVIGKGGETIRGLCEKYDVTININDDAMVTVAGVKRPQVDDCVAFISNMCADPELGELYEGKVVNTTDFGAFVSFMDGKEGLVHISEVVDVRLGHITDVMDEGDEVTIKVVDLDDRGKIRLTMKEVEQKGNVAEKIATVIANGGGSEEKPREPRKDRGGNRGRGGPRRN